MGFVSSKNQKVQYNFFGRAVALTACLWSAPVLAAPPCEYPVGSGNIYNYNEGSTPAPTGPLMQEQNQNGGMAQDSIVFPQGAAVQDFGMNNNIGGFGIRNGQNGWVLTIPAMPPAGVTPVPPPAIAAALQAHCRFPIWTQQFQGYPVPPGANDEYAMVVMYGTPQAMENAVFRFVSGQGDTPGAAIPVYATRTDPGLPAKLRADVNGSIPAQDPNYTYRYAALQIPPGTSDSLRMMAVTSRQGVIYYRAYRRITWVSGAQNMETPERRTRYRPRLAFLAPDPGTVIVNTCSPTRRVVPIDGAGNQVTVLAPDHRGNTFNVELSMTGDPADLYRDPNCIYPVTDPGIHNPPRPAPTPANGQAQQPSHAPHSNRLEFWMKSEVAQQFTITADHETNPRFAAYQQQVVMPEPPTHLKLSGPGSVNQSECSAVMRVKFYDRLGNHAALQSATTVQVIPGGQARLYSDAACSNQISGTMSVNSGVNTVEFYLMDPNAETLEINAINPGGGLNGDSMTFRVLSLGLIGVPASPEAAQRIADRMWNRIVGAPVDFTSATQVTALSTMNTLLMQGRALEAANTATQQKNFLDITVRSLATTLSNRIKDPAFGLTDFVTTWIGIIRDNESAQKLLTGDYVYVPDAVKNNNNPDQCAQSAAYTNNAAFNALADGGGSISDNIRKKRQCIFNSPRNFGSSPQILNDAAGLLTTRGWAAAHMYMGTNRRAVEFTFDVFMCKSLDDIRDTYAPDYRVRRDITRSPGGDPAVYSTDCKSCHGPMDGIAGAFAFFDYYPNPSNDDPNPVTSSDARLFYARTGYAQGDWKYNINSNNFPAGWVTGDDSWLNFYTNERNADQMGWSDNVPSSGYGAKAFGTLFANSRAFAECMAKRVFTQLCKRAPDGVDTSLMTALTDDFIASNYNMKRLYARTAALQTCSGSGE